MEAFDWRMTLDRMRSVSRLFRDYWWTRRPCKAVTSVSEVGYLLERVGAGLSASTDTDSGLAKQLVARYILSHHNDRVEAMMVIPRSAGVDKERYKSARAKLVDDWHTLSEKMPWESFKREFPDVARRVEARDNVYLGLIKH